MQTLITMTELAAIAQQAQIDEARKFVKGHINMMLKMKDCLPDGQWEDGMEDLFLELREEMPENDDPIWLEHQEEVMRNLSYWV